MINISHLMSDEIIKKHWRYMITSSYEKTLNKFIQEVDCRKFQEDEISFYVKQVGIENEILLSELKKFLLQLKNEFKSFKDERDICVNRDKYIFTCRPHRHLEYINKLNENYNHILKFFHATHKLPNGNKMQPYKKWLELFNYSEFASIELKTNALYDRLLPFTRHSFYEGLKKPNRAKKMDYTFYKSALVKQLGKVQNDFPNSKKYLKNLLDQVNLIDCKGKQLTVRNRFRICVKSLIGDRTSAWDITVSNYKRMYPNSAWSAYDYIFELGLLTCPYCNRQYITPIYSENGKVRADLDHYYSKSKYPFLALSIYNLIPSCKQCNSSLKHNQLFCVKTHLHPYLGGMEAANFSYEENFLFSDDIPKFEVTIDKENATDREKSNLKVFKLETLYGYHIKELENLLAVRQAYSKLKIESSKNEIKNLVGDEICIEDLIEILIRVPKNKDAFHELPLSKFRYDILKKLDFIE